ncbi:hypothetical protein ACQZ4R_15600 [Agrobacterium vitis]
MAKKMPTIDEIDRGEKLEAYLRTRPVEEAEVVVFRTSLRVMPLRLSNREKESKKSNAAIMRDFHLSIVSWSLFYNSHINVNIPLYSKKKKNTVTKRFPVESLWNHTLML